MERSIDVNLSQNSSAGNGFTLPNACNVLALLIAAAGTASVNPLPTFAAAVALVIVVKLLWLPPMPPVLLFAGGFQWLQVASPVFAANVEGKVLSTDFEQGIFYEYAAWLSLAAIVVLSLGLRLGVRGHHVDPKNLDLPSKQLSLQKLFAAYVFCSLLSAALVWVSWRAGGLRQPILAFASIKWIPIFLIFWTTTYSQKSKNLMLLVLAIEVSIGFSSYFSSFKSVLFVYLIVVSGIVKTFLRPQLILGALATLLLLLFWQAIKPDYRNFLNQGSGMQVVSVTITQRLKYLTKAVTSVTLADLGDGFASGISRLGYISYFAHSLKHVPSHVPHQDGALWLGAIKHFIMPRLFFPEKADVDESSRTQQFTGVLVAGSNQGTSISIGYAGESYIDFGYVGMFVPIFFLGLTFGRTFRFFVEMTTCKLLGYATASTIILSYGIYFGMSNISMLGGFVTVCIAYFIVIYLLDKRIWNWLTI